MAVSVQIRGGYKQAEKAEGDVFPHEDSFRSMLRVRRNREQISFIELSLMSFKVDQSVSAELCVGPVSDCAVLHYSTAACLALLFSGSLLAFA